MGLGTWSIPNRGTLQPGPAHEEALHCEVCGMWWVPDEAHFGCPGCELQRDIDAYHGTEAEEAVLQHFRSKPLLIERYTRQELIDLGFD
jgi:hypothetical protein